MDGTSKNKKKKNNKKIFIIIFVILILLVGVGAVVYFNLPKKEEKKTKTKVKQVESKYRMTGNGLDKFDLEILKLENKNENIIYSPLSIKYALAMLKEGASGDSLNQIDSVIGDYKAKKYNNSQNLSLANAMFIKDDFKDQIKESYINNLSTKYNADIVFDNFQTPDRLNSWVSDKTLGLINNLFDDVSENKFVLTNALGIDMDWNLRLQNSTADTTTQNPEMYNVKYAHEKYKETIYPIYSDNSYTSLGFNNKSMYAKAVEIGASINNYDIVKELGEDNIRNTITTEYNNYVSSGGDCVDPSVTTDQYVNDFISELNSNYKKINTSTDFMIYDDENVKAFAKDLKEYDGVTLQYIGIMPKFEDLDKYINRVDKKEINNIIDNLKTIENKNFEEGKVTKIVGYIPMFKFENKIDLSRDLETLGIKDVFKQDKANLKNMISDDTSGIYIDKVSHKANIDFSNDGIKAAAATAEGGVGAMSCGFEHLYDVPVKVIDMTFNSPYIFLIRDKDTNEVWFAGKVIQPTEKACDDASKAANKCVD